MRFECRRDERLPRLAWCARLAAGGDTVVVAHGPWVETWPDAFFEGAWNGAFDARRFDAATVCLGSGARIVPEGVLFVTATNRVDLLYSLRAGDELFVSNSPAFLLTAAGDKPDPSFPYYYSEILRHARSPVAAANKRIPSAGGHGVLLHEYGNLLVRGDLTTIRQEKPAGERPQDFRHCRQTMLSMIEGVFENGKANGRRAPYRPLSTISGGYDSPAVSVLARDAGCSEALTFATVNGAPNTDSGAGLARRLGLSCRGVETFGYRDRPDPVEPEFCADGCVGFHVPFASAEPALSGRLLCTGYTGWVWNVAHPPLGRDLAAPDLPFVAGGSLKEFRLRVGFQLFVVPYILVPHHREVFELSCSREMTPWRLGGEGVDKPLARRILEEAGIPRGAFAQSKRVSGTHWLVRREAFTEAGWRDFLEFYGELSQQADVGRWRRHLRIRRAFAYHDQAIAGLSRLDRRFKRLARVARPYRRKEYDWAWEIGFAMHWGVDRVRSRYATAPMDVQVPEAQWNERPAVAGGCARSGI